MRTQERILFYGNGSPIIECVAIDRLQKLLEGRKTEQKFPSIVLTARASSFSTNPLRSRLCSHSDSSAKQLSVSGIGVNAHPPPTSLLSDNLQVKNNRTP